MTSNNFKSRLLLITLLISSAFIFKYTHVFLLSPLEELIQYHSDDAYYYYEVAKNLNTKGGLYFYDHKTTTGFHPLWFVVVSMTFFIFDGTILPLRIMGITSSVLITVSFAISMYYLNQRKFTFWTAGARVAVLVFSIIFIRLTMEVSLLLPITIGLLWYIDETPYPDLNLMDRSQLFLVGLGVATIQIIRLDAVLLSLLIVGVSLIYTWRKYNFNSIIKIYLLFPPILTGLSYISILYILTRNIQPTSAIAKSLGGGINNALLYQFMRTLTLDFAGVYMYFYIFFIAIIGLYVFTGIKNRSISVSAASLSSTFVLIHLIYYLVGSTYPWWAWYSYPSVLVAVFVTPKLPTPSYSRKFDVNYLQYTSLVSCLLLILIVGSIVMPVGGFQEDNYETAEYTNQRFSSETKLAWGDGAGGFSYFSEHEVVQLEGLVMNSEYIIYLSSDRVLEYLNKEDVDYLIGWNNYKYNGENGTYLANKYGEEITINVYERCEIDIPPEQEQYIGAIWDVECLSRMNDNG